MITDNYHTLCGNLCIVTVI